MQENSSCDPKRELLRHGLATIAYRGSKAIRNATGDFSFFEGGKGVRQPGEILAHIGDLMEWALSMARGKPAWHDSKPLSWDEEMNRFFAALKRLDDYLASSEPLHAPPERLLQAPIADALSHVGQIAMLRRMGGEPVKGENYYEAEIVPGQVGPNQAKAKQEF
jgi:hypothetical protein